MTKIGNKGFTLVEVVIVSVVIVTILVTLFIGLNRTSEAFATRNRYYDIDTLYIASNVNKLLIKEDSTNNFLSSDYSYLNDITRVQNLLSSYNYSAINAYSVKYKSSSIVSLKGEVTNQTFKDYLDYLSYHLDFNSDYTYMIVTEVQKDNSDDCYYYALKVR